MAIIYLQKYNMYLALAIHLAGFLAAVVTGKHLYGYRLFPIIKNLLGTLTCINILTNGVSIIGSILLLNFGQSLPEPTYRPDLYSNNLGCLSKKSWDLLGVI